MRRASQETRRMSSDAGRKRSMEWVRRGSMEVTKLGPVRRTFKKKRKNNSQSVNLNFKTACFLCNNAFSVISLDHSGWQLWMTFCSFFHSTEAHCAYRAMRFPQRVCAGEWKALEVKQEDEEGIDSSCLKERVLIPVLRSVSYIACIISLTTQEEMKLFAIFTMISSHLSLFPFEKWCSYDVLHMFPLSSFPGRPFPARQEGRIPYRSRFGMQPWETMLEWIIWIPVLITINDL